jgi:osmoprotectant transport system substrate-binding protein
MRIIRRLALGASVLATSVLAGPAGGGGIALAQDGPPPVRIGSQNFYEARLMAEIYAQALEANGFTVDRLGGLGTRPERHAAFADGLVDLFPEYVGSGHALFDPSKATTDGSTNAQLLEEAYAAAGLPVTALGLTPGEDKNVGAVRQETAEGLGLASMSDLAAVQGQLRWGLPPECDQNAFCKGALETYGITFPPARREALFACDQPIADALAGGAIDFAWLCSTQPAIRQYGFVVLEDELDTQAAENIAPIVSDAYLAQVDGGADTLAAILDPISARITTETLFDLGVRVGIDQEDVADVAREFLAAGASPGASASPIADG